MPTSAEPRPVYRHIVVQRKAMVQHIDVEHLRRLREQMEAGVEIDEDLRYLVVKDTLKKSVKKAMAWAGHGEVEVEGVAGSGGLNPGAVVAEAGAREERGDQGGAIQYAEQPGVIVSRIEKNHFPGDAEGQAMPSSPSYLFHPGFDAKADAQAEFMRCAGELHRKFNAFSDNKFLLMEKELRAGLTLITLALTPIIAVPRVDVGVELLCEFHQKTRFGHVDIDGFDVFSEVGEYPVQVPTDPDMAAMFTTKHEFLADEATRRGPQG